MPIDRSILEDPGTSKVDFDNHIKAATPDEWEDYIDGVLGQLVMAIGTGVGEFVDYDEVKPFVEGSYPKPGYRAGLRGSLKTYNIRLTPVRRKNLFATAVLMGQIAKLLAGKNNEVKFTHLQIAHQLVAKPNVNPINCGGASAPPAPYCT